VEPAGISSDLKDRPEAAASRPDGVAAAIDLAIDALAALGSVGEDIEDEWQYVQDLVAAWETRLTDVRAARGDEPLAGVVAAAVVMLTDEAARIADPHRAIDWLSTLPQALFVALGERP
jgi:hypothetical protein